MDNQVEYTTRQPLKFTLTEAKVLLSQLEWDYYRKQGNHSPVIRVNTGMFDTVFLMDALRQRIRQTTKGWRVMNHIVIE